MRLSLPLISLPLTVLAAGDEPFEWGFYGSCYGDRVLQRAAGEKAWVSAHCYKRDGSEFLSHLDLDRCFSWENGQIRPEKDGQGISGYCHGCAVYAPDEPKSHEGPNAKCLCGSQGVVDWAHFDLLKTVYNDDGVLSCFGLKGERGLFVG
ncbi:hypothetical protein BDV34DRAFT_222570 [Aspergillus parasiticus]|uniref:Cyanovirin-N domain-containing protein n=1 Tax=Aspergillus parasiticus TaxID=5067 RepID=A0A5N6DU21_ASPPA|nr:hypothetical protein BDV34DRAFT_222570 [Aspergillus parasiticus]